MRDISANFLLPLIFRGAGFFSAKLRQLQLAGWRLALKTPIDLSFMNAS